MDGKGRWAPYPPPQNGTIYLQSSKGSFQTPLVLWARDFSLSLSLSVRERERERERDILTSSKAKIGANETIGVQQNGVIYPIMRERERERE